MKRIFASVGLVICLLIGVMPLATQAQSTAEPLYVSIIWHQHQPVYFKDPQTGIYERPWVRVHATKDYLDMVTILEDYPAIHATYNITPSLIQQIEDFEAGAKDLYWVKSEIPAEDLSDEDKRFILQRFFDINPKIIARFPRYQELADRRGGGSADQIAAALGNWTTQDYRDLQVLFNLGWTDPDWLAQEPLAALVAKGRDFEESDKAILFEEHLRIIREVLPTHARIQETGQIEITMTPFAHPILPLLVDSNVASVAMPEANLPGRFVFGQDAVAQLQLGVELYEKHFGRPPRGMWPAEGSVSPQIIEMIAKAGIQWIATDEAILARSLEEIEDFTRNSADTVQQADLLYRPYTVTGGRGGQISIIFRDHLISDKVGFEYSGTPGRVAANDLIKRLNNIQEQLQAEGAEGPHLVTILLDGENAWEHYDNDGKEFLHALYQGLSESENLKTVTPSEFLARTEAPRSLENLWAGSWVTPDFSTWIGEEEENLAWDYLRQMREDVRKAEASLDPETLAEVMRLVYIAEGSDWFWWYGSDQNSGSDENFDLQFRRYLEQIYTLIGGEIPNFVSVPIIAQRDQPPDREATDHLTVTVDGNIEQGEWNQAAFYALDNPLLSGLYFGLDEENLLLRVDGNAHLTGHTLGFYLRVPDNDPANAYPIGDTSTLIGFGARRVIQITFVDGIPQAELLVADGKGGWEPAEGDYSGLIAVQGTTLEIAASLALISPAARAGDRINMRLIATENAAVTAMAPTQGPALITLPDEGVPNVVLAVDDPIEDDNGPGTYTYPLDAVFRPGAYDATQFIVGSDEEDIIFQVAMRGPLVNDWGAPNGMGILAVDIYIDVDGAVNGLRMLLPGRNLAVQPDFAWDYAIFAEGWESTLYQASPEGAVTLSESALIITSNPGQRRVTIRLPRSLIEGNPADWAFAATIASQEGFPSSGVLRIRNVEANAEQWRLGGNPGNSNATRVIDLILPADASPGQAELLSTYPPSQEDVDDLTPDDFAQIPMLRPQ
jgi:alpha-amylase/alpha-mannosidase (GH57 family)